jgi:hypothetical protein
MQQNCMLYAVQIKTTAALNWQHMNNNTTERYNNERCKNDLYSPQGWLPAPVLWTASTRTLSVHYYFHYLHYCLQHYCYYCRCPYYYCYCCCPTVVAVLLLVDVHCQSDTLATWCYVAYASGLRLSVHLLQSYRNRYKIKGLVWSYVESVACHVSTTYTHCCVANEVCTQCQSSRHTCVHMWH